MAVFFFYSFFPPIDPQMIGLRHGITGTLVAFIVTGVFLKMAGLLLQVAVLVAAIAATEYFIRRKSSRRSRYRV